MTARPSDDDLDPLPLLDGDDELPPDSDESLPNLTDEPHDGDDAIPAELDFLDEALEEDDGSDNDRNEAELEITSALDDVPEEDARDDSIDERIDDGLPAEDAFVNIDTGEEGPQDAWDVELASELPALDSDEEGDPESNVGNQSFERHAFAPLGLAFPVRNVTTMCTYIRGVLAAEGATLFRLDHDGACDTVGSFAAEIVSVASSADRVAVIDGSGELHLSAKGSLQFAITAVTNGASVVGANGEIFVRTSTGAVLRHDASGTFTQIVEGVSFLSSAQTALLWLRSSGAVEVYEPSERRIVASFEVVPADVHAIMLSHEPLRIGVALSSSLTLISPPENKKSVEARRALGQFLDDGAFVYADYERALDASALWLIVDDEQPRKAGFVGTSTKDDNADGLVRAFAWESRSRILWVAGGFGVVAFRIRSGGQLDS